MRNPFLTVIATLAVGAALIAPAARVQEWKYHFYGPQIGAAFHL